MPKKLEKIKNMQARAGRAVLDIMGSKVKKLVRQNHGEICFVYKAETDKDPLLLKVHKFAGWPDKIKTETAHRLLQQNNIAAPELFFMEEKKKYFPRGFQLMEFVQGKNGNEAIAGGVVGFEKFHIELGKVLKKLHQIKLRRFGEFTGSGKYQYTDFLQYRLRDARETFRDFKGKGLLPENIYRDVDAKVRLLFSGLEKIPKPVLVHGDPTPDNSVWTKDGKVVLVDWDNAHAGFWLEDFTWLTFFGSHLSLTGSLEKRRRILYHTTLRTHGMYGLKLSQIEKMERALHISLASSLLGYYYFAQKNFPQFERVKERLFTLLKS